MHYLMFIELVKYKIRDTDEMGRTTRKGERNAWKILMRKTRQKAFWKTEREDQHFNGF